MMHLIDSLMEWDFKQNLLRTVILMDTNCINEKLWQK